MNRRLPLFLLLASLLGVPGAQAIDRELGAVRGDRLTGAHVILETEHVLLPEERGQLAASGYRIVRELGARRYIARRMASAVPAGLLPEVASVSGIEPDSKIMPSARREAAALGPRTRLTLYFHEDVTLDEARASIEAAGGRIESPLATGFGLLHSLRVETFRHDAVETLAEDDRVFQIHGPMRPIMVHNAVAAGISDVDDVHGGAYDLTGAGVTVSVWDYPGVAEATHPEFEGRVVSESGVRVDDHATHVTGTVAAKGIRPDARGMAPGARVQSLVVDDGVLEAKAAKYGPLGLSADNNSWGFITGWNYDPDAQWTWRWYGYTEDFGAYTSYSAALDKLVRSSNVVAIFSAGNDGNDTGPVASEWTPHHHESSATVWCYSKNNSGTDCPTATTPNCARCETEKHPADGPFTSVGDLGSAKSTLSIGSVDASKRIAGYSSRGPARDGRVKPDFVTKGSSQMSTKPGNSYGLSSGTSMAAPVATGISALIVEQWRRSFAGANPNVDAVRAVYAAGAEDLGNPGPDYTYGFGLINAKNSVDIIRADSPAGSRIRSGTLSQGASLRFPLNFGPIPTGRVVLAWTDTENSPYPLISLINDLDLKVVAPDGTEHLPYLLDPANPSANATRGVNRRDSLEVVEIASPSSSGAYTVVLTGAAIATTAPQSFTLVANGALSTPPPPCIDPYEPNDTTGTAWGRLTSGAVYQPKFCSAGDVDYFRFTADRSGTVTVTSTAQATPLRVTLYSNGTQVGSSIDVNANSSRTITTTAGSGTGQVIPPVSFVVRIEPTGQITGEGSYTFRATFGSSATPRPRGIRR